MRRKETKTKGIEPYVIDCMAMNLHENQALKYLDDNGYDISRAELYRLKMKSKNLQTNVLILLHQKSS